MVGIHARLRSIRVHHGNRETAEKAGFFFGCLAIASASVRSRLRKKKPDRSGFFPVSVVNANGSQSRENANHPSAINEPKVQNSGDADTSEARIVRP